MPSRAAMRFRLAGDGTVTVLLFKKMVSPGLVVNPYSWGERAMISEARKAGT